MNNSVKYSEKKLRKAQITGALRAVVSICLGFFGVKLLTADESTMDMATAWTFGALFILACIAFGGYTIYRFVTDMTDARLDNANKKAKPAHGRK